MLFPKLFLCECKPITSLVAIEFDKLASLAHYKINANQLSYWTEDLWRYVNCLVSITIQPCVTLNRKGIAWHDLISNFP